MCNKIILNLLQHSLITSSGSAWIVLRSRDMKHAMSTTMNQA